MTDRESRQVVVVGAGIAGLSTAYELKKSGFDVVVLESSHLAGGRMAEEKIGSLMNMTGASGLNPWYHEMFELCELLGIGDSIVPLSNFGTGIATDGVMDYTMSNAPTRMELLRSPVLGMRTKLRLATLLPDIWAARRKIDPCLIHTAADFDDENLTEYLERKVGLDFLEYIVSPLFNVALGWNAEEISKAVFLSRVAHITEKNGYTFKEGIGQLTRSLANVLDVRLNSPVSGVSRLGDTGRRLVSYHAPGGEKAIEADLMVVAVQGNRVGGMIGSQSRWEQQFFSNSVPYCQFGMVVYVLNKQVDNPGGRYFTRNTRTPLNFYKVYPGDESREGVPPRLWVALAPERLQHYVAEDGSNLEAVASKYVREFYPSLDDDVSEVVTQYKGYEISEFPAGQVRRVRQFVAAQECGPKNIYYVGDYLGGAGTGSACAFGRRTGRLISRHWGNDNRPRA